MAAMLSTTHEGSLGEAVLAAFGRKQRLAFALPAVVLVYLIYIFFAFNIPGLVASARTDNAAILLSDFWSYKTHVTRDNRSGEIGRASCRERV